MLRTLDLILKAAKCCLVLTLVRLLTSAFGYEFGISRQYLRLLEWILQRGKERIERCESEHRMQQELIETDCLNEEGQPGNMDTDCIQLSRRHSQPKSRAANPPTQLALSKSESDAPTRIGLLVKSNANDETQDERLVAKRERRVGVTVGAEFIERAKWTEHKQTNKLTSSKAEAEQFKRRRVSTPDGPPIFLLDDDDDQNESNDDGGEHQDELRDANSLAGSFKLTGVNHEARKHEFHMEDAARLVVRGISAIIDDEVTKRFSHEQLKTWNLLTRTNAKNYQFMSRSLGFWWLTGLIIRYAVLMPLRIMFTLTGFVWLISTMPLIGLMPKILRDKPYRLVSLMAFRMLSCGINSRLKFHNRQYRARGGSICVANHTSPLDVVLLASDNCYTLVGQRHGGLLGVLQFALSRAANHIWFERGEMRDRQLVAARLKEHVNISSNLPVLIFPEGTCINNSAVMMFRKGSFEVTDRIYPVAIKYDPRFGDPFWNSSKQSYVQYLLMIMSTWAIKCEVWYLQPMDRLAGEGSAEFANRVKAEIAKQAGLEDLAWDGQLKRSSVKPTWLFQQQEDYVRRLKLE